MALSQNTATFFEGKWQKGNQTIIYAADHVAWLGSQVFDGARRFDGVMPDLDLHSARLIRSAEALGMTPNTDAETLQDIITEGVKLFDAKTDLYIRPMMWAVDSGDGIIDLDPASTRFAICIEELPMPKVGNFSLTLAPYRRPRQDMALTEAKAGSLYPNNGRIMKFARDRGYSNAISLDIDGNVAETASTNVFLVKDGTVFTPKPNGCFLNGITRQRVIGLLREDGIDVREEIVTPQAFDDADEIFVTGNIAKVMPTVRYQARELPIGAVSKRARDLYFDYALSK